MKSSELRLTNWVSSKLHGGLHTEIFSILSHEKVKLGANPLAIYDAEEIEGIPLTEEWLLNFGFVNENKMFIKSYSRNEDNMVSFLGIFFEEKINAWIGYVGNNNTKFSVAINSYFSVHQLQNLYFSLTGEELTLKTE